jgi:hypothetical protein
MFFSITLDGEKSKMVGNVDALELLLQIAIHSHHLEVKMQSIRCIQVASAKPT